MVVTIVLSRLASKSATEDVGPRVSSDRSLSCDRRTVAEAAGGASGGIVLGWLMAVHMGEGRCATGRCWPAGLGRGAAVAVGAVGGGRDRCRIAEPRELGVAV